MISDLSADSSSATINAPDDSDERRFGFGKNWAQFLPSVDESRIAAAVASIKTMLGVDDLTGKRVLDIGSGSGLFSLAARSMGASVFSFDYDPDSVECTTKLRETYFPDDAKWIVQRGSILDKAYIDGLGTFDLVYVWGVLHHTGAMWRAIENATRLVRRGGVMFVALYNDQGWISRYWGSVKRLYNRGPIARAGVIAVHWPYLVGLRSVVRAITRRPQSDRGMNLWHDMKDWLGGWPFEVATPDEVRIFFEDRGFALRRSALCGNRHGCNEFVFVSQSPGE